MGSKKEFLWLYISIGSFFLMACSFLLMPINFETTNLQFMSYCVGIMFWVFLILGIVSQIILAKQRKNWFIRNRIRRFRTKSKSGVIAFLQNLPATIADLTLVISVIALIVSIVLTNAMGYACYIFMALLIFSFCMHCILNGKIYYYLTNQSAILRAAQPKQSEEKEKE